MSVKYAFIVGVEDYLDPNIAKVLYAESDARALSNSLDQHGFMEVNRTFLVNSAATKTRFESLLRTKLASLMEDDQLIMFYAGHGFADAAKNYITCHDTVLADLTATSIELQLLLSAIRTSNCRNIVLLLDCCQSGMPIDQCMRGLITEMTDNEFQNFCREADHNIVFAASTVEESSYSSNILKHGIWSYHVIEAFNGKNKRALERDRFLTISSLQNYLSLEVPHTVRHTFTGTRVQTPKCWGNMSREAILLDFSEIFAKRELTSKAMLNDMRRASLFGYKYGSVRSLSGFNKRYHHEPDAITESTRDFVRKLGSDELRTTSEELFAKIRRNLKYKRREIDFDQDSGSASIVTPDFAVHITLDIDENEPSSYILVVEVTDIRNYSAIDSSEFGNIFDGLFDRVVFELSDRINLIDIIDKIEEVENESLICVNYPSDQSTLEVKIDGFDGTLLVEPYQLSLVRTRKEGVNTLLEGCGKLPKLLSSHGIAGLLPSRTE